MPVKYNQRLNKWVSMEDCIDMDLLDDHFYYLVSHKDYKTPMKAKFHKDCSGYHFEVCTMEGAIIEWIYTGPDEYKFGEEWNITHVMNLPDMPKEDQTDGI